MTRSWNIRLLKPGGGKGILFFQICPDSLWSQRSLLFNRYRRSFPVVRRQRREGNNSPLLTAEVKNEWIYTATPPVRLHGTGRDNFTFCDIMTPTVTLKWLCTQCGLTRIT